MTTHAHRQRDWKVTTAHRVMIKAGWLALVVAVCLALTADLVGGEGVWWIVAGFALVGVAVAITLPEPVPRDLITERERWVDPDRRG